MKKVITLLVTILHMSVFSAGGEGGGGPKIELMRAQGFEGMTREEAAHIYERGAQGSIHPHELAEGFSRSNEKEDRRVFGFAERLEAERFDKERFKYLYSGEEDNNLIYQIADIPGKEYLFHKEDVVEFHIKDVGVVTIEELIEENAFETKGSVEVLDSRLEVTKYYTTDGEVHYVTKGAVLMMKLQKRLNLWF